MKTKLLRICCAVIAAVMATAVFFACGETLIDTRYYETDRIHVVVSWPIFEDGLRWREFTPEDFPEFNISKVIIINRGPPTRLHLYLEEPSLENAKEAVRLFRARDDITSADLIPSPPICPRTILVLLTRERSAINPNRIYTPDDFPEVNLSYVRNRTIDGQIFRIGDMRFLTLYLAQPGRQNVLDAIELLSVRPDIYSAEVNGISTRL